MPVDTVVPDTFESCLDAMMCGNDCDFLNGLYSLDVIDIMHLVFSSCLLVRRLLLLLLGCSSPSSPSSPPSSLLAFFFFFVCIYNSIFVSYTHKMCVYCFVVVYVDVSVKRVRSSTSARRASFHKCLYFLSVSLSLFLLLLLLFIHSRVPIGCSRRRRCRLCPCRCRRPFNKFRIFILFVVFVGVGDAAMLQLPRFLEMLFECCNYCYYI